MRLPQIRTETTMGQIGISTVPGRMTIEQPPAEMHLEQPRAEVKMKTTPGRLTIDQTEAWAAMDIKHIFRRIKEQAERGRQAALEGTARRAAEGDELMRIEDGGRPIAEHAERNSRLLDFQYNYALVPPPLSVKIHYEPGTLTVDVEPGRVINRTVVRKPVIEYEPGRVDIYMKQYPSIDISVVDVEV